MNIERELVSYLEKKAGEAELPPGIPAAVIRGARRRRRVVASATLLSIAALSFIGVLGAKALMPTSRVLPASGGVPNVIGRSEAAAVKLLARYGLVAEIRYDPSSSPAGMVMDEAPPAGAAWPRSHVIGLLIAGRGELNGPLGGPKNEPDETLAPFAALIGANPQAFVGMYRDQAGTPVVVFNPGISPTAWRAQLGALARGRPYRTESCSHSLAELNGVADDLATADGILRQKHISFGVGVDAQTCTVRVHASALAASVLAALSKLYGPLITIDASGSPHRL